MAIIFRGLNGSARDDSEGASIVVPVQKDTQGSILVAFAMEAITGPVSCSDSAGNVYAKESDDTYSTEAGSVRLVVFAARSATALQAAAGDAVTVTCPGCMSRSGAVGSLTGLSGATKIGVKTLGGGAPAVGVPDLDLAGLTDPELCDVRLRRPDYLTIGLGQVTSHK